MISKLIRSEGGFALPLALAVTVVLSISVTAMITYTSSNSRSSSISSGRNAAYHLAEAGINNAINVIHSTDTPMFANLLSTQTTTYDNGSVRWSGTLDDSSPNATCPGHLACWNIASTGIARNPTGAASLERTLRINVPLDAVYSQHLVNDVYDYVFVYGTGRSVRLRLQQLEQHDLRLAPLHPGQPLRQQQHRDHERAPRLGHSCDQQPRIDRPEGGKHDHERHGRRPHQERVRDELLRPVHAGMRGLAASLGEPVRQLTEDAHSAERDGERARLVQDGEPGRTTPARRRVERPATRRTGRPRSTATRARPRTTRT